MEPGQGQLIAQGAEAKVYLCTDATGKKTIRKVRLPKSYRHPELDKTINVARVKSESKNLQRALKLGINVPKVLATELQSNTIVLEYLPGAKLKTILDQLYSKIETDAAASIEISRLLKETGALVFKIHNIDIIHGDLTTSNMIVVHNQLYLIDFGLSYFKNSAEDRAVDLYVLERAMVSTHPWIGSWIDKLYLDYHDTSVLKKLEAVRQRGRKKVSFG